MNEQILEYLKAAGLTGLFLQRADRILQIYSTVFAFTPTDVFVSEYVDAEGKRQYENFWLLTSSFVGEAKDFLKQDAFDLASWQKRIDRWEVKVQDYQFEASNDKSRAVVQFQCAGVVAGELKASGTNCVYLRDIVKKYILPNMS